jgi:hypothetical protein
MALTLTTDERTGLERRVRSLKIRSEDARRARVILMLANGDSYSTIEASVPCYRDDIERDLLALGIFTSVDLARKIRRYIRHYNKTAKPVRWSYRNPAHRISRTSASAVH